MARLPRFPLAGVPQHVVQRGNNKQRCFFDSRDYRCYLAYLEDALQRCACSLHAYVLMGNHVHMLVTPDREGGISLLMQHLGRRYVGTFNAWHDRTGTLWEGRYRASVVVSDRYILACYRYIEMNPVRAGLVAEPSAYRWSSYSANADGARDSLIRPHSTYLGLGRDPAAARLAYKKLFADELESTLLDDIRRSLGQQVVLGDEGVRRQLQAALRRRTTPSSRGRRPAGERGDEVPRLSHWQIDSDPN